jgi:hypothetical protein
MADPHIEHRDTSWARTAKDLFSGAAGGVAQVLLGIWNPFVLVFPVLHDIIAAKFLLFYLLFTHCLFWRQLRLSL